MKATSTKSFSIDDLENQSRLSSVTIDAQELSTNKTNLSTPLRGILKKSCEISGEKKLIYSNAIKICNLICLFMVSIPLIFCDIYYGYSNTNCVNSNPKYLDISLKLYLLLSGFMGIILLVLACIIILFIDFEIVDDQEEENDNNKIGIKNLNKIRFRELELIRIKEFIKTIKKIGKYMLGMFNLIWNILGSVVFWGYYYENGMCKIEISTYIFISLVIKLLASSIYLYHQI